MDKIQPPIENETLLDREEKQLDFGFNEFLHEHEELDGSEDVDEIRPKRNSKRKYFESSDSDDLIAKC